VIRRSASALALVALLLPAAAFACPVCSANANDRNEKAFRGTTALLSLLPLTMFAGGIWWLRKKGYGDGEFIDRDESQDDQPKK
jgi:hypothetical protein